MATQGKIPTYSATDLIQRAKDNPPKPIVQGLLYEKDVCLIHGTEECFKSIFVVQMAESIATGHPFLRRFRVPHPYKMGIIETEMNEPQMGERLRKMYPSGDVPENLRFLPEEALRLWRRGNMDEKFELLESWVKQEGLELLTVDIASDFFRGTDDPNKETCTGAMFDMLRNLPLAAAILVRHDRKHGEQDGGIINPNERICGSGEWKHDPEVILHLKREDRRTHEVTFDVGKLRYGSKPDRMELWFDAGNFRLTPLPPVIAVLESGPKSREELIKACGWRFHIEHSTVDAMIQAQKPFLHESQRRHEKVFEIDLERAKDAPWYWLLGGGGVRDTEDSISCTLCQASAAPATGVYAGNASHSVSEM